MTGTLLLILGLAAGVGATLLLRRAWKRPLQGARQGGLILGGWALAAASLALLALAGGFDRGTMIGLCVVGVAAYALIGLGVDVRKPRKTREAAAPAAEPLDPRPRPLRIARATLRCVAAVGLAATASLALAVAWSLHGPGSAVDRVVTAAYALPLVWGAAMTWSLSDERLRRPVIGLVILTLGGLGLAYLPRAGA